MVWAESSKLAVLLFCAISSSSGAFVPYPRQLNNLTLTPTLGQTPTGLVGSLSTGASRTTSFTSSANAGAPSGIPSSVSSGASIVPITIKAADGSDRSTTVRWSVIESGSTSTTDQSGHPTIIAAPFWTCGDPLCVGTGCVLAVLCSGGAAGVAGVAGVAGAGGIIPAFDGFPPPLVPSAPPRGSDGDSPSPSVRASPSITESSLSSSASVTSSVSTTGTSFGVCSPITTVADPGPTPAEDPDEDSRRRLRLRHHGLVARNEKKRTVSKIGDCMLQETVMEPLYLSYRKAMDLNKSRIGAQNEKNRKIYSDIRGWYNEHLATDGSNFHGTRQEEPFEKPEGEPTPNGSVDHVWEKSNLEGFLDSVFGSEFDCDDLNHLFSCGISLKTIYNEMPSMDIKNPKTGFAFMNRDLNGMKGWMSSNGFERPRFKESFNTDDQIIQALQRQAIIFNFYNTDEGIQTMHNEANNRIYSILLALDSWILENKPQRANGRGDLTQRFGPTFKTWYQQNLTDIGTHTYKWASDQVARLNAKEDLQCRAALETFQNSPLYGRDKFQIDQSHLTWAVDSTVKVKRGLVERDGTCLLSTNSASTSTPSSTVSSAPTSTPSSTVSPAPTSTPSSTVSPAPTSTSSSSVSPASTSSPPSTVSSTSTSSPPSTVSPTSSRLSTSGSSPAAPSASVICQLPGQVAFPLANATSHFEEYCARFDGQKYPAITDQISSLKVYYDHHAGVKVELWSSIAIDDRCKQGEVKFNRGDCLTALGEIAAKCKNDDGTSIGGNAESGNCATFGFIGNRNAPVPQTTAAPTTSSQLDPSASAASAAAQAAADATWSAAAAVPTADCRIIDSLFSTSGFEIYNINGWAGDDGGKLRKQESGCGILDQWQWETGIQADFQGHPRDTQTAFFTLDFFKGGCVERAVHSAGGPPPGRGAGQLACQHGPLVKRMASERALNDTTLIEGEGGVFEGSN